MKGLKSRPVALYRHFCGSVLLYIGISSNPFGRLGQHRQKDLSWIAYRTTRMDIEWFATRTEATHAEKMAILAERPCFNKVHLKPKPIVAVAACEDCDEFGMVVTGSYLACRFCGSTQSLPVA